MVRGLETVSDAWGYSLLCFVQFQFLSPGIPYRGRVEVKEKGERRHWFSCRSPNSTELFSSLASNSNYRVNITTTNRQLPFAAVSAEPVRLFVFPPSLFPCIRVPSYLLSIEK